MDSRPTLAAASSETGQTTIRASVLNEQVIEVAPGWVASLEHALPHARYRAIALYDARGEVLHCTSTDFGIEFRQALNDALDAFVLGAARPAFSLAGRLPAGGRRHAARRHGPGLAVPHAGRPDHPHGHRLGSRADTARHPGATSAETQTPRAAAARGGVRADPRTGSGAAGPAAHAPAQGRRHPPLRSVVAAHGRW